MMGPVKFKQTLSPTAGLFTGHFWGREDTMCFSTYKLYLMHIDSTFKDVRMPWNRKYDKVRGEKTSCAFFVRFRVCFSNQMLLPVPDAHDSTFKDVRMPWNRKYDKVRAMESE
jgi:hypothetical protein